MKLLVSLVLVLALLAGTLSVPASANPGGGGGGKRGGGISAGDAGRIIGGIAGAIGNRRKERNKNRDDNDDGGDRGRRNDDDDDGPRRQQPADNHGSHPAEPFGGSWIAGSILSPLANGLGNFAKAPNGASTAEVIGRGVGATVGAVLSIPIFTVGGAAAAGEIKFKALLQGDPLHANDALNELQKNPPSIGPLKQRPPLFGPGSE